LILGFIFSVALTSLAFVLFDEAPEPTYSDSEPSVVPPPIARTPLTVVESFSRDATVVQANSESESGVSSNPARRPPVALEELEKRAEEARIASELAQRELHRAQRVARWAAELPPSQAIVLPSEFDYLSDDPSDNHELIQRENVDAVWAATTEAHIQTYLAERPEVITKYGYPKVECRATRCELAFVAQGVGAAEDFRDLNAGFFDQDWTNQFKVREVSPGIINLNVRNQGDVTTILWHLTLPPERFRRATSQTDGASR
jgi:hypothetical protein